MWIWPLSNWKIRKWPLEFLQFNGLCHLVEIVMCTTPCVIPLVSSAIITYQQLLLKSYKPLLLSTPQLIVEVNKLNPLTVHSILQSVRIVKLMLKCMVILKQSRYNGVQLGCGFLDTEFAFIPLLDWSIRLSFNSLNDNGFLRPWSLSVYIRNQFHWVVTLDFHQNISIYHHDARVQGTAESSLRS